MFEEVNRSQFGIPKCHKTSTDTQASYFKCKLPTVSKEVGREEHAEKKTMNVDMKISHSRVTTYYFLFGTTSVGSGPVSPCLKLMLLLEQMQRACKENCREFSL